jgi:molybdopterin-containing oxidoreductase family iron-sulfur binding subunit
MNPRRTIPIVRCYEPAAAPTAGARAIGGGTDGARREFLKRLAAGMALGTLAGCGGPPLEEILPYVDAPERLVPGVPLYYATSYLKQGYARGVLVESNMGRPTKVEGNRLHPASRGATDAQTQGAVLDVWDPDRSQSPYGPEGPATWTNLLTALDAALRSSANGNGVRVLTGTVTSPTLVAHLQALSKRYPEARWHTYEPLHDDRAAAGSALAFGRPLQPVYDLEAVRTLVVLDARLFSRLPGSVRYARDYVGARRRALDGAAVRLYAVEAVPSLEGVVADERLALAPPDIERLVWRVAAHVGLGTSARYPADERTQRWEAALARALTGSRGASLIVAGPALSTETHALVHALNAHLGNAGATVSYIEPVEAHPTDHARSLRELAADMHAGRVQALVMLGGNPVYDAPGDAAFADALKRVPYSLHHALYRNETSLAAQWHAPLAHDFEAWSDARAYDGTASIVQPVMRPLYGARAHHELLAWMGGAGPHAGYDIVRAAWKPRAPAGFDAWWQETLRNGVVADSASAPVAAAKPRVPSPPALAQRALEVVWIEDDSAGTGQYTNNAWLQEIPRTHTKLTWDNALLLGPHTAQRLQLATGDVASVAIAGRSVEAPVWVLPGLAEETAVLPVGYGRRAAGRVGNGVGYDAYALMTAAPAEPRISRTGRTHAFATTQNHGEMEGRDIVRHATLDEYRRNPHFATDEKRERVPDESLYPEYAYERYKWGMVVDINACIGCNACTIACQAENNIAVVGKEEVRRGREMHWIRIDRYYEGPLERPRMHFMPVPCMQCENAPCEEVCPVGATMHDSEGINVQVYNRCVGTRFCSNNCPYKVRRFNFLQYSNWKSERIEAVQNPEVTVRQRGVMEKCNYCLQRITRARIEAETQDRRLRDGEVVTACQAVCPTQAIFFGDLNDEGSTVSRVKRSPLNYALLSELNTRPRTTYLARVINRDTELPES